ncbi:ArgS-related anticodon-binding protein NrtL [Streptomyces sp. NPDC058045]|uniref:ArgS-related anticodon-binding protein NrtL n=1 Tax=Streptomyces sp. NPDC058045 TaxID=3346311 RepID=UPI0036DFFE2A
MTPVELSRTVLHAVRSAVDAGELSVAVPERTVVERPRPGGCGDYATGIALQLARPAGRAPRQVAEVIRRRLLAGSDGIRAVDITGPGFLNITLDGARHGRELVRAVLAAGERYGFVGAEPAAASRELRLVVPAEVRAVVVAEALVRVLESQGWTVSWDGPGANRVTAALARTDGAYAAYDTGDAHGGHRDRTPHHVRPVPAPSDPWVLGVDGGRWALLAVAGGDRPRIGAEHLVQREQNPLFRVRYAAARTRALVRNAAELGFGSDPEGPLPEEAAPLLAALAGYPVALAAAARLRAPDRVARQSVAVADAFLGFQAAVAVLPMGDEKPSAAHRARLALAEAAGTVLAGGLSLLGVDAPETI